MAKHDLASILYSASVNIKSSVFMHDMKTLLAAARLKEHDLPEAALLAMWFATDLTKRKGEQVYIRIARKLFNDQQKEVIGNLPSAYPGLKSAGKGTLDWSTLDLSTRWSDLQLPASFFNQPDDLPHLHQLHHLPTIELKADLEQALAVFDLDKWYEETVERFGPSVAKSVVDGYTNGLDLVGIDDLEFPDQDPRAIAMAAEVLNKTKGINDTIVKDLSELLPQAVNNGADIDELTDLVEKVFGVAKNRARTIAQTTSTPVFEQGQTMAFEDAGIENRSWLSRRDGKVRTGKYDHLEPDGQVVAVTAKFLVSGEYLRFAGDPSGSAGNVINCRCTQKPVLS